MLEMNRATCKNMLYKIDEKILLINEKIEALKVIRK